MEVEYRQPYHHIHGVSAEAPPHAPTPQELLFLHRHPYARQQGCLQGCWHVAITDPQSRLYSD